MSNFIQRSSTLDLNGPVISWISQPSDVTSCGVATFTGIATATFPSQTPTNPATNTGTLNYQWYYRVGTSATTGQLYDGTIAGLGLTSVTGSATTTLTVYGTAIGSDLTLENLQFFLRPDVAPSAYGTGDPITAGTARSTGNANNELSIDSNTVSFTQHPDVIITTQPTTQTVSVNQDATFNVVGVQTGFGSATITYRWTLDGTDATDSSTISGSSSDTLTISSSTVGIQTVNCRVSHPTACNSPLYSNTVNFNVVSARELIKWELVSGAGNGTFYSTGEQNLSDGSKTWDAPEAVGERLITLWASEKDTVAKITMAGAAGRSNNGQEGGKGGKSTFYITLDQNVEYTVKLGSSNTPQGDFGGGGGGSFLYRGGTLVACVGGGGGAGRNGKGGNGGGVGLAGIDAQGNGGGEGGGTFGIGQLPLQGFYQGGNWLLPRSGLGGGRVSGCTFGQYWTGQGYGACQDMGYVKFRGEYGLSLSQTTDTINRGFKVGLSHRENEGRTTATAQGGGGSGAVGGGAGSGGGFGGGGGSGYSNGEVNSITHSSSTDQDGYFTIEL